MPDPDGARAFVEQLRTAGVRWVFGNPGTTEYAVLDAIQECDGIDLILCLHEGVAVSAAIGYARASRTPGVVLLHAGPGLGNGIGMLYNAFAYQTPLLVYVGQSDQAALHLQPTLSADLVAMAAPVSRWAYEVRTSDEIPLVLRRALTTARTAPCGPVMVSVPMDLLEQSCAGTVETASVVHGELRPDEAALDDATEVIVAAKHPAIVVGDGVAIADAVGAVSELAHLLGAPVFGGTVSEVCVAPGEPLFAGVLPADGAAAHELLAGHDVVIALGTKLLAQIFPIAGPPVPGARVVHIGMDPWELGKNQGGVLVQGNERLAAVELIERISKRQTEPVEEQRRRRRGELAARLADRAEAARQADQAAWDRRPMSVARAASELARAIPRSACVVDESISALGALSRYLSPEVGSWFGSRGGGIGAGLGMAVGVALARPGSPVVGLVADGSAMYGLSALWTAAHYGLPVTWVVLNNRSYRILKENALHRRSPERRGLPFLEADLTSPEIDFVSIASGLGVEALSITDPDEIGPAITGAVSRSRPQLIEISIDGEVPA